MIRPSWPRFLTLGLALAALACSESSSPDAPPDQQAAAAQQGEQQQPPVETIRKEHELIGKMAVELGAVAGEIGEGGQIDQPRIEKMLTFFAKFADDCHHRKEEQYLFPALKQAVPDLVAELERQHERGRELIAQMRTSLPQAAEGQEEARQELVRAMVDYSAMMSEHIQMENGELLTLANHKLEGQQREEIARGYWHVENKVLEPGFHKKYHELAKEILHGDQG